MADVINTGGGDSGAGLVMGVIVAVVLLALFYFVFVARGIEPGNAPDVNVNIPTPSAPSMPGH